MHNYHERDSNLSMHNINYNRFRITCFSQHEVSKSQRGNCIPMKCGDCFLFSCKLYIETYIYAYVIREFNKIFFLQIKTSSSNIDIYLTLFLSPNSSEGRAWANKILLARYIKPEKIDYDNVNMFKWQSHFWLKTNKMLLIYSNDDLDIKDSNSNIQEIELIVKSLLFLFGLCKSVSVRFRNNYSMMVFVAY